MEWYFVFWVRNEKGLECWLFKDEERKNKTGPVLPFSPKKTPLFLHDDSVGLETNPELFISVDSAHKAPSGGAPSCEWEK